MQLELELELAMAARPTSASFFTRRRERKRGARGWVGDKQKPFGLASASGQSLAFGYAS